MRAVCVNRENLAPVDVLLCVKTLDWESVSEKGASTKGFSRMIDHRFRFTRNDTLSNDKWQIESVITTLAISTLFSMFHWTRLSPQAHLDILAIAKTPLNICIACYISVDKQRQMKVTMV